MQTTPIEQHFLPDDELLVSYEKDVLTIAKRRVIKLLFRQMEPIAICKLLALANISLNSLAAVFVELSDKGFIAKSEDGGIFLTHSGMLWALKCRKSIFMEKKMVVYTPPYKAPTSSKRLVSATQLPKDYCFSWVDTKLNRR